CRAARLGSPHPRAARASLPSPDLIRGSRGRVRVGVFRSHSVHPNGPSDVLERLLAHVFEGEVELARRILPNAGRDANAARLGQAFEPGRDVNAVARDVAVLDDDVADIDADAELDAPILR